MELDSELRRTLDNLTIEPRSRLEPYHEYILRWRRNGWSYDRIRKALAEKCGVQVAHSTLIAFVQRRSRPRKPVQLEPEPQAAIPVQPVQAVTAAPAKLPSSSQTIPSGDDPYAEARERMRKHKEAPIAAKPLKVFNVSEEDLDGTKPLRMIQPNQQKENH